MSETALAGASCFVTGSARGVDSARGVGGTVRVGGRLSVGTMRGAESLFTVASGRAVAFGVGSSGRGARV
jgi:hypothetical protein